MTDKQLEGSAGSNPGLPMPVPTDWKQVKFAVPTDEDMNLLAALRSGSDPWKGRGETQAESLEALTKLRPFISVGKLNGGLAGYVTIERD
ncbi:MAG TPA: N-acetyltransferase, partial [Archangium sp.]